MKVSELVLSFIVIILFSFSTFPQGEKSKKKNNPILLDSSKSAVYLEFVKTGKCNMGGGNFNFGDLCKSKSEFFKTFDAFWVRLTNNTRWAVGVTVNKAATEKNSTPILIDSTTFVDDDGETGVIGVPLANGGAEMDVVYKNESETGCDFAEKTPKGEGCKRRETAVPDIPLPPISSDLFVASGQSIIFPVDFKHIKKYINLYVLWNFEWEYSGQRFLAAPHFYTQHRAYFGWFRLEKGIKKEAEKNLKKSVGMIKNSELIGL